MTALPLRIAIRLSGAFLLLAIVLFAVSLSRAPALGPLVLSRRGRSECGTLRL